MRGLSSMRPRLLLSLGPVFLAAVTATTRPCWAGPTTPAAPAPPQAAPANPVVDEQTEFDKGRNAYRAQKYDEADTRFLKMLDPKDGILHDKVLIKQARMYWAATRIAQHQNEDAADLFHLILTEDRNYDPDPLAFPTDVVNAFLDTRAKYREELEASEREQYRRAAERRKRDEEGKQAELARVKLLELYATRAEVTEENSRWIALLPFGAGQFQNHQRGLGWVFASTEGLLLTGTLITVPVYLVNLHDAEVVYSVPNQAVAQQYLDRARATQYVNLALNGALILTAVIGVIQAQAAFVPEVTEFRVRTLPTVPAPASHGPTVSFGSFGAAPLPGREGQGVAGGLLTLHGAF
jgi:hypothetical protein